MWKYSGTSFAGSQTDLGHCLSITPVCHFEEYVIIYLYVWAHIQHSSALFLFNAPPHFLSTAQYLYLLLLHFRPLPFSSFFPCCISYWKNCLLSPLLGLLAKHWLHPFSSSTLCFCLVLQIFWCTLTLSFRAGALLHYAHTIDMISARSDISQKTVLSLQLMGRNNFNTIRGWAEILILRACDSL